MARKTTVIRDQSRTTVVNEQTRKVTTVKQNFQGTVLTDADYDTDGRLVISRVNGTDATRINPNEVPLNGRQNGYTLYTDGTDTYWDESTSGGGNFDPIITNPEDKQVLRYDLAQDEWVNEFQEGYHVGVNGQDFGSDTYKRAVTVQYGIEIASRTAGNRYHRDITNAGLFSPLSPSNMVASNFDYEELGILQKVISDDNINGSYHITFTQTGTVSVGDAIYIVDGTINDGEEPEDNDCYCVKEIRGNGHIILNRPILTSLPSEYPDGHRIYTFTYNTVLVENNDFITFEGEGWVGYPFVNPIERMRYVTPNDAADADKLGKDRKSVV